MVLAAETGRDETIRAGIRTSNADQPVAGSRRRGPRLLEGKGHGSSSENEMLTDGTSLI